MSKISQLFRDMIQGAVIETPGLKDYWQGLSRAVKRRWINFFSQFLIGVVVCGMMVGLYHHLNPPLDVATVDIVKLSKHAVEHIAGLSLDEEASREALQHVVEKLESTLKAISIDNNTLILPVEAVITGAEDITDLVQSILELPHE